MSDLTPNDAINLLKNVLVGLGLSDDYVQLIVEEFTKALDKEN